MSYRAIVTGHSRGLGAAIAEDLLVRGIPVLAISRAGNAALAARFPALRQHALDLSDLAALARWMAGNALREHVAGAGAILLVNNAGVVGPVGPLDTQAAESVAGAIALNVTAPMILSSALAACRNEAELRILHVSSGAARSAYAGWSVYGATKAALDQHARAVALDETPGIRICSLAPGVIDTDMQTALRAVPLERFPLRERFVAMKREKVLVAPAEAARHAVEYLLGDSFGSRPVADLREALG